jgi:hypothetical protein
MTRQSPLRSKTQKSKTVWAGALSACALMAAALALTMTVGPLPAATAASVKTGAADSTDPAGLQRRARPRRPSPRAAPRRAPDFSHQRAQHRQACDSCHKFPSANWNEVREGDAAFPDITQYPEHASCLGCHRRQFFTSERPSPSICAVCHQSAVPRSIIVHPFPALPEAFDKSPKAAAHTSDFLVFFPHDKHLAVLGDARRGTGEGRAVNFVRASFTERGARARERDGALIQDDAAKANEVCATCHQTHMPQGETDEEFITKPPEGLAEDAFWLKKGTFKTSPRGHASCFTCHSADSGIAPAPSDCATCHRPPPAGQPAEPSDFDPQLAARMNVTDRLTLALWARRQTARYRHEWFSHAELKCSDCHKVEEMNTAEPRTTRVPVLSCGGGGSGCHITAADEEGGALNLAVARKLEDASATCTKCHAVLGARPVPSSHASALSAIRK